MSSVLAMAMVLSFVPIYGLDVKAAEEKLVSGDFEYGIHYFYDENGNVVKDENKVKIIRYKGDGGDVVIPSELDGKRVVLIGDSAFSDCNSLMSVEIPDSVTQIWEGAFFGCSNLANVTIPNSVTLIEFNAFDGCSSLANIIIPDSVAYIGESAFRGCKNLKRVTIPASVTATADAPAGSPQNNILPYCSSLESISVEGANPVFDSRDNCNAVIQTSDDGNILVMGCKNTKIPDSVTQIGRMAFAGCSDLSGITIPDGVTGIGQFAFLDCSKLAKIAIPPRACLKNAFWQMYSTICGRFAPNEGGVAGYVDQIWGKYTAKWGMQMAGMNFQTRSSVTSIDLKAVGWSTSDGTGMGAFKVDPDFVVCGMSGSEAERYANENGLKFEPAPENDLNWATVALEQDCYAYDGTEKKPSVTVMMGENTLVLGTDYTVEYSDNVNVGTAKVAVAGKGAYSGQVEKTFAIRAADISTANVTLPQSSYAYDGTAKTPSVTVVFGGKMLVLNTDYTVSYSNNINAGTAAVTVTGKGNYTGSKTVNFTIVKAGEQTEPDTKITCKKTLYKVTYGAKPFKINAASNSKMTFTSSKPKIAAVDKKFKKNVKSKSLSKTSYTFTKLKTGKKYYVRIRSYKKSDKETLNSVWSKAKVSGKIKK